MLDALLLSRTTDQLGSAIVGLPAGCDGSEAANRVLCVDDEPLVLDGLSRSLRPTYDVSTAIGGAAGLARLEEDGPFSVVISDMRMPGMNGAEFLAEVRRRWPDTVRMLLTGYSDVDAAITAVNEGHLFRFLSKPCPKEVLLLAMEGASEQFRLIRAEREALARTLKTTVSLLVKVLNLSDYRTFYQANTVAEYVGHMASRLDLADPWRFDLAALLSQIGTIMLPSETVARIRVGQEVDDEDQYQFDVHPELGHRLVAEIPGLESVAEMIGLQATAQSGLDEDDPVLLGGAMLRLGLAIDHLTSTGLSIQAAVRRLAETGEYPDVLTGAMSDYRSTIRRECLKAVPPAELRAGMVLDEAVCLDAGRVLIPAETELTASHVDLVGDFVGLHAPVRVRLPILDADLVASQL